MKRQCRARCVCPAGHIAKCARFAPIRTRHILVLAKSTVGTSDGALLGVTARRARLTLDMIDLERARLALRTAEFSRLHEACRSASLARSRSIMASVRRD